MPLHWLASCDLQREQRPGCREGDGNVSNSNAVATSLSFLRGNRHLSVNLSVPYFLSSFSSYFHHLLGRPIKVVCFVQHLLFGLDSWVNLSDVVFPHVLSHPHGATVSAHRSSHPRVWAHDLDIAVCNRLDVTLPLYALAEVQTLSYHSKPATVSTTLFWSFLSTPLGGGGRGALQGQRAHSCRGLHLDLHRWRKT